jgi:hypothetical protein
MTSFSVNQGIVKNAGVVMWPQMRQNPRSCVEATFID